ncbi:MAG: CinA family protein [Bdellovibrionaceae bacterium]|nr:CinA family protein [Pseudobdellovibrionaceae bacterium]
MNVPTHLLKKIHKYFYNSKESLSVAESCTGGLLSFWLTELPGSSRYFKGGIVAYQTVVKVEQLGLSSQKIKQEGLVTPNCVRYMAQSIKNQFKSDWSLSISGVAGPSKGDRGENVGKIAFSVCSPDTVRSLVKQFNDINRQNLRYKASFFALDFLISEFK